MIKFLKKLFHIHDWKYGYIIQEEWYGCIKVVKQECTKCGQFKIKKPRWEMQQHCKVTNKNNKEEKCAYYKQCFEEDSQPLPDSGNYIITETDRFINSCQEFFKKMRENFLSISNKEDKNGI